MKMLAMRCLVALSLLIAAAVAFANPFKSKIISGDDPDNIALAERTEQVDGLDPRFDGPSSRRRFRLNAA